MKKILIALLVVVVSLQSCVQRIVPLMGKYQEGSVKSKINSPIEDVWESIVDVIAETGASVKIIDKSSGLIMADAHSFKGLLTTEDRTGKIINPNAFIVMEKTSYGFGLEDVPKNAIATWNFRVKEDGDGSSIVGVNLHSIQIKLWYLDKNETKFILLRGESTGNFEKWLIDSVIDGIK